MKDIMLDLETLDTLPTAAIVQIGACYFDPITGEIGDTLRVNTRPDLTAFSASYDTLAWWIGQGEDARHSVFSDVTSLDAGISALLHFAEKAELVWAQPPSFDVVIVENAARVFRMTPPWKYSATRCVRTLCGIAGVGREDRVKPELAHNALSDAIAQAKTVAKAFELLKGDLR